LCVFCVFFVSDFSLPFLSCFLPLLLFPPLLPPLFLVPSLPVAFFSCPLSPPSPSSVLLFFSFLPPLFCAPDLVFVNLPASRNALQRRTITFFDLPFLKQACFVPVQTTRPQNSHVIRDSDRPVDSPPSLHGAPITSKANNFFDASLRSFLQRARVRVFWLPRNQTPPELA